jgi:putative ABC transport system substrate-binding protein
MTARHILAAVALSLAAAAAPREADTQTRLPRVGMLANGAAASSPAVDAFRTGLRELGHVEGKTFALDIRWADGRFERMPELAAELMQAKPDVLVTAGPYGLQAARRVTRTVPIVMIACDPVDAMVERIARPSGHITGVTCMSADLTPKRLQLLKEAVPALRRLGVLYNPFDPNKADEVRQIQEPARALGIVLLPLEAGQADAFERVLARAVGEGADALLVLPDPLTLMERRTIADLATRLRLPAMYGFREFVAAGGLMSYGTMQNDLYRRAAAHVDKLLKGASPSDVPVEQATRFELVISMKAARALALRLPPALLLRADQVLD